MKSLKFIILFFFIISIIFKTNAYEGRGENLGREGPPPAGPYRLGFKELERAIKTEKKGKLKKATETELIDLIKKRSNIYSKALYEIKCDNLTKNEIVNKIVKIYERN